MNPTPADDGLVLAPGLATPQVRRAELRDAAAFARTMGHPQVLGNLLQQPWPTEALWQARLAETLAPGKADVLLVAELPGADGTPQVVGNAGLHPTGPNLRRRHAMHLGIAVHPVAWGRGVGDALMAALCHWADHWGQVLRLELNVFHDNARAIRLYERHGFQREGLLRGYALREGAYVDCVTMGRLHPRPPGWEPGAPGA